MGAVPKRRISTGRKGRRRSAIKLSASTLSTCTNCGQPKMPHQACPHCHYYKGKSTLKKSPKKETKKVEKAEEPKEEEVKETPKEEEPKAEPKKEDKPKAKPKAKGPKKKKKK